MPSSGSTSAVERPITLNDPARQLELEADDAMAAMKKVLSDMGKTAAEGLDPHKLTAAHPLIAMGAAAVAGFAGAAVAIPAKKTEEQKRLERIEQAVRAQAVATGAAISDTADHGRSMLGNLMVKGFNMLKPTLVTALTSAIAAKAGASSAAPSAGEDDGTTVCDETQVSM